MSSRSPPSQGDDEELSLSLEFQGLQISVRGSADRAASFVQRLATEGAHSTSSGGFLGAYSDQARHPAPASTSSVASWQEVEPAAPTPRRETRASIEASFPDCPQHLRGLAASLSATSEWSPDQRVQRAWKAGSWAAAVRSGRVQSPNRTPTINLGNRYYAAVQGPNISSPRVYKTSRELFAAVGSLEGSDTICHGFPSKAETEVYLAAAGFTGVAFP